MQYKISAGGDDDDDGYDDDVYCECDSHKIVVFFFRETNI